MPPYADFFFCLGWNNSRRRSGKSGKSSACVNNVAMPSPKPTSLRHAFCRRTIPRNIVDDTARWLARDRTSRAGGETGGVEDCFILMDESIFGKGHKIFLGCFNISLPRESLMSFHCHTKSPFTRWLGLLFLPRLLLLSTCTARVLFFTGLRGYLSWVLFFISRKKKRGLPLASIFVHLFFFFVCVDIFP